MLSFVALPCVGVWVCFRRMLNIIIYFPFAQEPVTVSSDVSMCGGASRETGPMTERLPSWNPLLEPFSVAFQKWPKPGPAAGLGAGYAHYHDIFKKFICSSSRGR